MATTEVCTTKPGTLIPGCRCTPCRARAARMCKANRTGHYPRAPRSEAALALTIAVSRGWSDKAIASASGLPRDTVHAILVRLRTTGDLGRPTHLTSHALAGMGEPTEGRVGAVSTSRRLRALSRMGWGTRDVAGVCGVPVMTLERARAGGNSTVLTSVWRTVREVYRTLADRPGPSQVVAARAELLGWEAPAAWDDDTIEDPAEPDPVDVDEVAVARAMSGGRLDLTRAEQDEVLRRMNAAGAPDRAVAAALGLCGETVLRRRKALGVAPVMPEHLRPAWEARAS